MTRCMVALDMQDQYKPPLMVVEQVKSLTGQLPTVVSVGTDVPGENPTPSLVEGERSFPHCGLLPAPELVDYLKSRGVEEALVVGGMDDAKVLAAGFAIKDAGIMPMIVPPLCYGNLWYEHSVTLSIWEKSIGKVYQNLIELGYQTGVAGM